MSIQVISPETEVAKTTEVSPDQTVVSNPSVSKKVSAQVASTQAPVKATAAAALAKKEEEEAARQAQIAEAAGEASEAVAEEQVAESGETVEAARTIATVAEEIDASADSLASALTDAPMMFAQAGAAAAGGAAAGGISTAAIVAGVAAVGVAAAASSGSSSTPATTPTPTPTPSPAPIGQAYTLTTAADSFVGDTDPNTFTGALGRVETTDYLDGGAGNDVATLQITGTSDSPVMDRIETINVTVYGASTLAGGFISGATQVNVAGGAVLTYSDVDGEAFALSGASTGLTANAAATTDTDTQSITLTLSSGALGTITLGEASGTKTDFDLVNLVAAGATSVTLTETSGGFAGTDERINVTGSSDLTLTIDDAELTAGYVTATSHTGVLTLDIAAIAGAANFDATNLTGVDVLRAGVDDNTISGLASGMTVRFDVASGGSDQTLSMRGTSSTDSLTLSLNHGTAGSSITTGVVTATGIETLTINSTGTNTSSATVTNTLEELDTTTANSVLTITGDKNLTIGNGVSGADADWTRINISNTATTNITLETGGQMTVVGGTGNDRIEFDTFADFTTGDSLSGGDGVDTIAFSVTDTGTQISSTQRGLMSGFEVLEYEGALAVSGSDTIDLTAEGFNTLYLNGVLTSDRSDADALTVTVLTGNTLRMGLHSVSGASGEERLIVSMTSADAQATDVLNLRLTNQDSGASTHAGFTASNVETINIFVEGDQSGVLTDRDDVITISDIVDAHLSRINLSSVNTGNTAGTLVSDSLTITAVSGSLLSVFDASAFTGNLIITGVSGSFIATNTEIIGGSGVDSIAGGAGSDSITGGLGADSLDGNGGADIIFGGDGADTITGDTGNDTIDGGAGVDVITGGGGNDSITSGTGADVLHFDSGVDTVTDFSQGIGGDVIDQTSLGNSAGANTKALLDDDGTLKVLASTSTGAVVFTDGDALGVSVATYAALDAQAEILALFGANKVFEAVGTGEEATLLVAAADTGHTYVWNVDDTGDTETATLVAILNGIDATELGDFRVTNFVA